MSYLELRTVRLGGCEGSKDRQVSPKKTFRDGAKNMVGIVPYNALGTGDPVKIQQPVMGCPILEEENHLTQTFLTDFRFHSSCFKYSGVKLLLSKLHYFLETPKNPSIQSYKASFCTQVLNKKCSIWIISSNF